MCANTSDSHSEFLDLRIKALWLKRKKKEILKEKDFLLSFFLSIGLVQRTAQGGQSLLGQPHSLSPPCYSLEPFLLSLHVLQDSQTSHHFELLQNRAHPVHSCLRTPQEGRACPEADPQADSSFDNLPKIVLAVVTLT